MLPTRAQIRRVWITCFACVLLTLAWAVVASAQEPRFLRITQAAVGVSIVAHAADLTTTAHLLACCGDRFREANPLYRWAEDKPASMAIMKMSTAVAVNAVIVKMAKTKPKTALVLALGQLVLVSVSARHNAKKVP